MVSKKMLSEYARLAVKIGVNVQKGQPLLINGPVEAFEFIRECVKVAYEAGASEVWVDYRDNNLQRMSFEHVETETLKEIPSWAIDRIKYRIDKKYCVLHVISDDPDLLEGIDSQKVFEVQMANMKASNQFQYYTMNNIGQWSIVAYPNRKWAKKVFPELSEDEAYDRLWDAIMSTSRVSEDGDVTKAWDEHNREVKVHSEKLNEFNFKSLHFENSLGTDLKVGLIRNHIWEGGADKTQGGVTFNPNIPTEEVFTMPDCYHIDGTVVSTKPLSYNGKLIDEFKLTFKDGKVIEYSAKTNEDVLKNMLDTDDGSRSLGEVALISYDSPISNSNILFYNTLFDENASCHLALGKCYPTNVKGGSDMTSEELHKLGGNDSMIHVDFMFGSRDISVTGTTYDDKEVVVFADGNFVF